jgi:hypothetical protein
MITRRPFHHILFVRIADLADDCMHGNSHGNFIVRLLPNRVDAYVEADGERGRSEVAIQIGDKFQPKFPARQWPCGSSLNQISPQPTSQFTGYIARAHVAHSTLHNITPQRNDGRNRAYPLTHRSCSS